MPGKDNVFILIINQKCSAAILYNPVDSEKRLPSAFKTYDLVSEMKRKYKKSFSTFRKL